MVRVEPVGFLLRQLWPRFALPQPRLHRPATTARRPPVQRRQARDQGVQQGRLPSTGRQLDGLGEVDTLHTNLW